MKSPLSVAALGLLALACILTTQAQPAANQTTTSTLPERLQRLNLFPAGPANAANPNGDYGGSFLLRVNTVNPAPPAAGVVGGLPSGSAVNNAAARQLQADKNAFPFLATLPNQGSAVFITTLQSCGIILPHIHPRGTEQYVIISGNQTVGIAEENGGRQNIVFNATAGQIAVVPQGLLHYNFNNNCVVNVFLQVFNSADAGTISLPISLNSLKGVDQQSLAASGFSNVSVPIAAGAANALDPVCLARCGLPATGGGFNGLTPELAAFIGVPAPAPAGK